MYPLSVEKGISSVRTRKLGKLTKATLKFEVIFCSGSCKHEAMEYMTQARNLGLR